MKAFLNYCKKAAALFLILSLLFSMAACGQQDAAPESSSQASQPSDETSSVPEESSEAKPEDDPAYKYSLYTQTVEYGYDSLDYPEYAAYRSRVYDDQGKLIRTAQYAFTKRRGSEPQYHYLETLSFYDENERMTQTLRFNIYREITRTETYEYDDAGNLIQKKIVTALGNETYYDYTYDDAGRMTREERYRFVDSSKNVFYYKDLEYDRDGAVSKIQENDDGDLRNSYFVWTYDEKDRPDSARVYKDSNMKRLDYTLKYEYSGDTLLYVFMRSDEDDFKYGGKHVSLDLSPFSEGFDFTLSNFYYKSHVIESIDCLQDEEGRINRIDFIATRTDRNELYTIAYREYLEGQPLTRTDFYLLQILTIDEINELKIKEPFEIEESTYEEEEIIRPEAVEVEITLDNYQDYFEIIPTTVCYTLEEYNDTELFYPYGLTFALNEAYADSYILNAAYYIPEHSDAFVGYELEEISYLIRNNTISFEPVGHIECTLQLTITDPDAINLYGWSEKTVTCKIGSFEYAKFLMDYTGVIDNKWEDCYPSILGEIYSVGLVRSKVDASGFGPQDAGDATLIGDYITVEVVEISGTLPVFQ